MSEAEWQGIDLQDRVEYAVNAVRALRAKYINDVVRDNPDIDMQDAEDIISGPEAGLDLALMWPLTMEIAEGANKRKRRRHEEEECEDTYWHTWNKEAKPIADIRKKRFVDRLATGLMTSRWAAVALPDIKKGLLASRHAGAPNGKSEAKRNMTPISINSSASNRSTPRLEALAEKDETPAWAKTMIETIITLQRKVDKLEGERRARIEFDRRERTRKETESRRTNRPPPALPRPARPQPPATAPRKATGANALPVGGHATQSGNRAREDKEEERKKIREADQEENRKQEMRIKQKMAKRAEEEKRKNERRVIITLEKEGGEGGIKNADEALERLGLGKETVPDRVGQGETIHITLESKEKVDDLIGKGETAGIKQLARPENRMGVVVHLVDKRWEGKMEELKTHIEEKNQITLAGTPRWLSKMDTKEVGTLSLVIHVESKEAKDKVDRGVILDDGYMHSTTDVKTHTTRTYVDWAVKREMSCTTCCGFGHTWMQCRTKTAKCGICGKEGHRTAQHKCVDEKCGNRGWCNNHRQFLRCANCGGPHSATSKWCNEKANYVRATMGLEKLPARSPWKPSGKSSTAGPLNRADD